MFLEEDAQLLSLEIEAVFPPSFIQAFLVIVDVGVCLLHVVGVLAEADLIIEFLRRLKVWPSKLIDTCYMSETGRKNRKTQGEITTYLGA